MRKHPVALFLLSVAILVIGAISFIQSEGFARILKGFVARHLPSDLGIQADFSDLSVGLFPPSVAIRNPKVLLSQHNLINLPPGSSVTAKRIDLRFRFFQMFSGDIRINEVAVVDGEVNLVLHAVPEEKKSKPLLRTQMNWDELFQIRADAVGLENTVIHIRFSDSPFTADLTAEQLRLAQWKGRGGLGYELRADLKDLNSSVFKNWIPETGISRLSAIAHVNAQGFVIDDLATLLQGIDVHLNGEVKGNVLSAKELPFDSKLILKADLNSVSQLLSKKKKFVGDGKIEARLRARGDLLALAETLRADGQVLGEDVRYDRWTAEHVSLEGDYKAIAPGHGEVSVTHGVITSRESARAGGNHPASGGKIELGAFKYVIGASEPISVPLKLERAHIQWLAAGAMKDVYPLDTRLSGSIAANFRPAKNSQGKEQPWGLQAAVNLSTEQFQLDNQRLGQEKPLKRVLRMPNVKLEGPVRIDPTGVAISNVALTMAHSHLDVSGTIDSRGFDLLGEGPVSLADLVELSEVPIAGDGTLKIHAHGPSSRVLIDFDGDLKNARYLRLQLGSFVGRMTWDDGPDNLIFDHVQATKGQTSYTVNGMLELGKNDLVNLDVGIPKGNILDLTQIFDDFTQQFWWFPRTLAGPVTGTAKVSGGVSMPLLVVTTDLTGKSWEYLGERFRAVSLKGGYDRGKYQITDIHGVKQNGKFQGRISFDAEKHFDWSFRTDGLQVTDLDHLARLDVPFRGDLQLETRGSGTESALQSYTLGSITNLSVRGVGYQTSRFQIRTDNGIATGSGYAFGNQASFDFTYGLTAGIPSSIRAELTRLDFSPTILLLNPKLMQEPALLASVSGGINLKFRSGEIERGSGSIAISDYQLSKTGTNFRLAHAVSSKITEGEFLVSDLSLAGPNGSATLNLRGRPSALDGTLSGDMDLGITEFLTSTVSRASGAASLDFTIEGTLKAPKIYGSTDIASGSVRVPSLDSPFENITGTLQLRQNVVTIQNLQADLGGGPLRTSGTITLFPDRYPTLALRSELSGNRVRVYPFQYVKLRGALGVNGAERPYLVDGSLVVDSALCKEKMLGAKQEESLKSLQYAPPATAQGSSEIPFFKLKVDVAADHGILIQNDLFDAELKGQITVVNTLEAPRIIGSAEMLQGKMKFKDRQFQIQSANILFDNPNVINPQFNLTATTEVSNTKIQLYASGRPSKLKVDLTSNPAMAESEILSLLALGNLPTDPSKRIGNLATDRSAVQQGEAASLILQSLDFNREVQEKTGFEFQLDEYENNLVGQSIFTRSANETAVAPKIVVKRRIGDRVTLSYGSTVGVDVNKQTEANAEFRVTPGFSVLGIWDSYEFNDLQQKKGSQSSYGFDLRLQKSFR